ncbi:MAG: hypothetical protein HY284_02340 [Nitrospirae bacterium]|nr:hypothetical protein [Nitrospirota bacterium]
MIGLFLLVLAACAPTAPNLRALTKQAGSLGAACNQAAARFVVTPTVEARREVLGKLKDLNEALVKTAEYEKEARRANSVDLIDANRAFLETGRAWTSCSLKYNKVLVAIGDRDVARHNYMGLLVRLTGPQFGAERRRIQAALDELNR